MIKQEPNETDVTTADFSKEAVAKAVLKNVTSSPFVTVPAALGVVGVTAFFVGAALPPLLVYGLMAGLGVGGGLFALQYFARFDENAHTYLEKIRSVQRRLVAEMPKRLESDLKAAGSEKGLAQLKELEAQFEDFQQLLERKFSKNGMTLNRFLGTAEQVRAGALYKLQMVLDQMKAIESLPTDLGKVRGRVQQNGEQARLVAERAQHRKEVLETIERLYTDVEESLTRLSEISIRIASVGMGEGEGMKFESYLGELKALASQASTFNKET